MILMAKYKLKFINLKIYNFIDSRMCVYFFLLTGNKIIYH